MFLRYKILFYLTLVSSHSFNTISLEHLRSRPMYSALSWLLKVFSSMGFPRFRLRKLLLLSKVCPV